MKKIKKGHVSSITPAATLRAWSRARVARAFMYLVAAGLIAVGVVIFLVPKAPESSSSPAPLPAAASLEGDEEPSEAKPDPNADYRVPDDHPRRIMVPEIDLSGFVQSVGVNGKGEMAVPSNIHAAGWFERSPAPGEEGVSIIDGHVQGRYETGIFKRLPDLVAGSVIKVEMGDYTVHEYEVIDTVTVSKEQANDRLYEQRVSRQLTLITCTGSFNDAADTYDDRHIVYATYIGE